MKLSKRLKLIESMVSPHYDHIWDCCCDHGYLGASLLDKQNVETVHFVDIVPELMQNLENKLKAFYDLHNWQTHCLDVSHLPLQDYKGKHLVIIAGVGGDLTAQFIANINAQHPNLDIDYLVCPVHHLFTLRAKLNELKLGLVQEALVEDNKRYYEVLLLSSKQNQQPVSAVGEQIWQAENATQLDVAEQYLKQTLSHYQRIAKGKNNDVAHIITAYEQVKPSLKA